jgi:hypothetical protein
VASALFATAASSRSGGSSPYNNRACVRLKLLFGALLSSIAAPAIGGGPNVQITHLSDLAFGTITNLGSDALLEEDVCVYSDSGRYNVTATGTGSSGAFLLANGGRTIAFEVQWSPSSGRQTGTKLTAKSPLTGLTTGATQAQCTSGPSTSASLIVILRSTALSGALPGTYSGQLTLLIAPE